MDTERIQDVVVETWNDIAGVSMIGRRGSAVFRMPVVCVAKTRLVGEAQARIAKRSDGSS